MLSSARPYIFSSARYKGAISAGQDVIAVGGTGGGSDSAAIIKATSTADMFSSDTQKRLEIREIFAMPMKKKWWK